MRSKLLSAFLVTTLVLMTSMFPATSYALPTFEESFTSGLKAFNEKKYEEAISQFEAAVQAEPSNASALLNLGLSYFYKGDKGKALAYLRQSYYINPYSTETVEAYEKVFQSLEVKELPHQVSFLESLDKSGLFKIPVVMWQILALLVLFFSLLKISAYVVYRKEAKDSLKVLPSLPVMPILGLIFWLFLTAISLARWSYYKDPRATVIVEKAQLMSAPNSTASVISEIPAGLEVLVLNQNENWAQIKYPGSTAGWVEKKSILMGF